MVKVSGKRVVPRSPGDVWRLLMSPEVLRKCIQGCEELEPVGNGRYRLVVKVGIGLVKGRLRGEVELADVVERESYRLEVQAQGMMGSLRGTTRVGILPMDGGGATEVSFESEAQVHGVLATLGSRYVDGAARSMVDAFFGELASV